MRSQRRFHRVRSSQHDLKAPQKKICTSLSFRRRADSISSILRDLLAEGGDKTEKTEITEKNGSLHTISYSSSVFFRYFRLLCFICSALRYGRFGAYLNLIFVQQAARDDSA